MSKTNIFYFFFNYYTSSLKHKCEHTLFPSEEDLEDTLLYFTLTDRENGLLKDIRYEISSILPKEPPASFQRKKQTEITLNIK